MPCKVIAITDETREELTKADSLNAISAPILRVPVFQLWAAWEVISRGSTMLWGTWPMQSSSSWLMITSCLTNLFLLFCWHLGWHEIGLMPGVSGEYMPRRESCMKSLQQKKTLEVLVVADIVGQNSMLWTYAAESNEELLCDIPWGSDSWKQNLPQVLVCTALGWVGTSQLGWPISKACPSSTGLQSTKQ